ncbi:MAG: hypothetical protein GWP10_00940 [Nitrospiraceae bacterium]|nr:hypothetical protein [Nitrospiraceae bacterium]
MRDGLVTVVLGYSLLLIETTWGPLFQLGQVRLDGLVSLVAWYGLYHPLPGGIIPVLILGILCEELSGLPAGLYPLVYVSEYLITCYILNHVVCITAWQQMLLVSFVSIEVIAVLLIGSGAADLMWPWGFGQILLNSITAPLWFFVFDKIRSIYTEKDKKGSEF